MFGRTLFNGSLNWRRLLAIFFLLDLALLLLIAAVYWRQEDPNIQYVLQLPEPTATFTPTVSPTPTQTGTPTPWPSPTPTPFQPTATATVVVYSQPDPVATAQAQARATARAADEAAALAQIQAFARPQSRPRFSLAENSGFDRGSRLVLAHYFTWYDGNGWNDCNISAGDRPLEPYDSDDVATMARHLEMARTIGLNGFSVHWFAPGDRTDRNFSMLLNQALGTDFTATVVFSHHFWPGLIAPTQRKIGDALSYIINQYGYHPNFLRLEGKPVIFFTDVYRTGEASSLPSPEFWASLRDWVDPQRETIWIAEGLDPAYLDSFDGLYVFKISHATARHDYERSPRWGQWVRDWAEKSGQAKLWIATISPGWDDLRSPCRADVRVRNTPHRLERANGATYAATFQAALASDPDWLIVGSFNEWVEGTYIEPSQQYGDQYLNLTRDFIQRFQNR
jgi:hypothetical protein